MEVEELTLPQEKAEAELKFLREALKRYVHLRKEESIRDYRSALGHLKHKGKLVEIHESFKKAGLNKDGDPRLAICRADGKECFCQKHEDGSAIFSMDRNIDYWDMPRKTYSDIKLPAGTFQWQKKDPTQPLNRWNIKNEKIKTLVPIIPAKILVEEVKHRLRNYHILWEVEEWKPVPPKDPILLKQLTPNLFGVLASWDLTPLERAIIRGRIQ